ncbi:hypothetical protein MUO79_08625 [Candidatus Bathyarchaeota archaeon]|nr:hypothetical protein [Candidatus Bathyarchaeota archaeon]
MMHWPSFIHDYLLGWSALVLASTGFLLMFLSPWWTINLLGLALVAFIGSMELKIRPAEHNPRTARAALILYGAASVVLNLPQNLTFGILWILTWMALMIGGTSAFFLSLGFEPSGRSEGPIGG